VGPSRSCPIGLAWRYLDKAKAVPLAQAWAGWRPTLLSYPRGNPLPRPESGFDFRGGLSGLRASDGSWPGQIADSVKVVAKGAGHGQLESLATISDPHRSSGAAGAWLLSLLCLGFCRPQPYLMLAFGTPGFSPLHGVCGLMLLAQSRPRAGTHVCLGCWRAPGAWPCEIARLMPAGTVFTLAADL